MKRFFESTKKYLLIITFCAFLFIMFAVFLFIPKKTYSSNEKRYLQQMPAFSWSSLKDGSFGKEFETFLSDQFPNRNLFVGLNAYYDLFSGRNGASGIYCGKDGYLINTPTEFDKEKLGRNVGKFNEFAEAVDIPLQMMVVPTTGYIMDDKLPALHERYLDGDMLKYIKNGLSDKINFLDMTQDFISRKNDTQLFYKTDHHWTSDGAYSAYLAYCAAVGLTPTPKSDYKVEGYPGFYGTTYSKSALWNKESDIIELWKSTKPQDITVEITDDGEEYETSNDLFFTSHLEENDKYPVFLNGNHSLVKITNSAVTNGKKLLMIKDSFSHCLAPFLADNYSEIYLVDLRYYKLPVSDLVNEQEIDEALVIYGLDTFATDSNIIWLK